MRSRNSLGSRQYPPEDQEYEISLRKTPLKIWYAIFVRQDLQILQTDYTDKDYIEILTIELTNLYNHINI